MASKSKQAFMTPDEFVVMVHECKVALELEVVLEHAGEARALWNGHRETLLTSSRIFFAERATVSAAALSDRTSPARLGWVMAEVPHADGTRLFCVQIGARGDWFDKDTGNTHNNKSALRHFDKIWKKIAMRLRFPIRARNIVTGAEASYPSFGYSSGAAECWAHGGQLRQRGVENLEFMIPDVACA